TSKRKRRANMPSFCPIYDKAREKASQLKSGGLLENAHRGLVFNKFADAWRRNEQGVPEFDKGDVTGDGTGSWLRSMAATPCGDPQLIAEACKRQQELAHAMG